MIRASFGKTAAGRLLIGAGALALLMTAIAGCEAGNDAPTLEFHAASGGTQTIVNGIKITNVFVLGAPSGATVPAGQSASLFLSLYNGGAAKRHAGKRLGARLGRQREPQRRLGRPAGLHRR